MDPGPNENGNSKSQLQSEYNHEPPSFESQNYSDAVDIKGRPVDKSKTGTWRAALPLYAIHLAKMQAIIGVFGNLVPYLAGTLHRPISEAATITTNLFGTTYLLSVLGGFLADSYLGAFFTLCTGGISIILVRVDFTLFSQSVITSSIVHYSMKQLEFISVALKIRVDIDNIINIIENITWHSTLLVHTPAYIYL